MLLDVSKVLSNFGYRVPFRFDVTLDTMDVGTEKLAFCAPVIVQGMAISADGESVAVSLDVSTVFLQECVRCLSPVQTPFTLHISQLFTRGEIEEEEESEILPFSGDEIDLLPVINEGIVINAPVYVLCKQDCKGLCPTCGANLNEGNCGCNQKDATGNPFAALKDMFHQDEEV